MRSFLITFTALAARVAAADPPPPESPAPPAVPADQVSGVTVEDDDSSTAREIGRVVLSPIRLGSEVVFAPLRGGAWLIERYQLRDRVMQVFTRDDGQYGIFPTAFVESEVGLNLGVHAFDNDVFGHGERLALAAGYGGELKQRYDASLTSGKLAGGTRVGLRLSYRAWDRSNFFGIGNGNVTAPMAAPAPLDQAVHTRFAQDVSHVEATSTTPIAGPLSVDLVGAYTLRHFSTDAELDGYAPTLNVYDEMSVVGFQHGADNFYGEAGLSLDTRSEVDRYISHVAPSSGWYGHVGAGFTQGVDGDPSHYVRYSADLRRYIDLYNGDRVLVVRGYLEGVTAPIDEIPFTDLPRIGGAELLRGFEHDRFRDRVAAVATLEYDFPLQSWIGAYTFVDAGRVAHDVGSLDPNALHVGWGGGIELHTLDAYLLRAQAAHSEDGTFISLAFAPTYDTRARARRK
ncbi:MAG TPA: BamA/TamA family outer membrane protein [Kofleriaceae bacterium]|jgi:hypothetical protein